MEIIKRPSKIFDALGYTITNLVRLNLCHEKPDRCLSIFGKRFPICARCLGILAGIYFLTPVLFVYFYINKPDVYNFVFVPFFIIPGIIDWYTQIKSYRLSNNTLRLTTGILIGFGLSLFANLITFSLVK